MTTGTASLSDAGAALVAPVREGEVVAEKYRVQETLGVGGMGVVVAAQDEVLERRVAIKFLLPRLAGSETAGQRFVREARAATRITSEHVVRLLEIDKLPSGTPFFVMEYLEGRDLRAVLRDDGPLRHGLAVDYMLQALQAVAEGHLKGIVHRDIKPGNLFLATRADGTPLIKVLDFGIAKRLESHDDVHHSQLTSSDDVRLGSPAYMPPEQLQDPRDVDTRSDIWSIGATLYELLSGKPPFEGPSYVELVSHILSAPPKPISSRSPARALPKGLHEVLVKCLEKDRARRYANAAELATALAPFGSEDARVSLTRVVGMNALPSPQSPAGRASVEPAGSCTTTLPVAAESDPTRPDAASSTGHAKPAAKRSWIVVAGVAGILGLALWLRNGAPPAPPVAKPNELQPAQPAQAAAPAEVSKPAPAPVPVKVEATPPSVSGRPALAAPGREPGATAPGQGGTPPAPTKATAAPPRTMDVFPAALRVEPAPPAAAKAPEAPAAVSPAGVTPAAAEAEGKPGRSEEIERLIERRR